MSYKSIDQLQDYLATNIFNRTNDAKKASGRALGTFVEIITYYLLKTWNLQKYMSIETKLPEYGNPLLTHNVEFTLHKLNKCIEHNININNKLSSNSIFKILELNKIDNFKKLFSKNLIDCKDCISFIKNGALIGYDVNNIYSIY